MDAKPCLSLIRKRFHSLTKVEQKVAEYILQNSSEIVSLSTSELADRIPVAKSAIVRCCQSLGFEGYTDLKLSLMTELSQQKSLNYTPYIHAQDQPDGILDKIFSSNIKTLQDTAAKLDRTMLQAVVKRLDAAEKIGDYPIITAQEAQNLLLKGSYLTTVPSEYLTGGKITEEAIVKTELIYRTNQHEQTFMPYYRFYVELGELHPDHWPEGLINYGAYYVPAVEGEYLSGLPAPGELNFN